MFKFILSFLIIISVMDIFPQSFNYPVQWPNGAAGYYGAYSSNNFWIGDFNGDGLADKLALVNHQWIVALSNGTSFGGEVKWLTDSLIITPSRYYIGDFNGDGMKDIAAYTNDGNWRVALAYQNTVNQTDPIYGFKQFKFWNTSAIFSNPSNGTFPICHYPTCYIGDFNGDGIDDIMSYRNENYRTYWDVSLSDGRKFNSPTTWRTSVDTYDLDVNQVFTKVFVSDINKDGASDIIVYIPSGNSWYISVSNAVSNRTNTFSGFTWGNSGQGSELNGPLFGDIDGDGDNDKIYISAVTGQWWVAKSQFQTSGNSFGGESNWGSTGITQSTGLINCYCGDFNGDRLCDVAFLKNDGSFWIQLNTSLRPTNSTHDKIVAVWWQDFYRSGHDNWLTPTRKLIDPDKVPVVGIGSDTTSLYYNSSDSLVICRQIRAMIDVGINLIIIDHTNGWKYDDQSYKFPGVTAYKKLFTIMKDRKTKGEPVIPIVISLGYEFWGRRTITGYAPANNNTPEWIWSNFGDNGLDRWKKQYTRLDTALKDISADLLKNGWGDLYFNYLGHPLLIAFITGGLDYPPRIDGDPGEPGHESGYKDWDNIPMWHRNDFTIIPANHWTYTTGTQVTDKATDYKIFYNDGRSEKRFWGWGESHSAHPQPYNKESMSVFPGTTAYWNDDPNIIERANGDYYIQSWKRTLEVEPNFSIIGGWNNWAEETSIEGCRDKSGYGKTSTYHGWTDLKGNPQPDWYLQITRAYSNLYSHHLLLKDTYFRKDNDQNLYHYQDGSRIDNLNVYSSSNIPENKPVILIPANYQYNLEGMLKSTIDNKSMDSQFEYNIEQNYPNPFNPSTIIKYTVKDKALVCIKVFNILGQEVSTIVNEIKDPGNYEVPFNASNLATGLYIYNMQAGNFYQSKKMLFIK